jgi:hypothetical protein
MRVQQQTPSNHGITSTDNVQAAAEAEAAADGDDDNNYA